MHKIGRYKNHRKKPKDWKLITLSYVPRSFEKPVAREETHKPGDTHQAPPPWIRNRETKFPTLVNYEPSILVQLPETGIAPSTDINLQDDRSAIS